MKTITLIFFLISVNFYGQNFSYKKTTANGIIVRTKGTVSLKDSILTITGKGFESKFTLKETGTLPNGKQFKAVGLPNERFVRITFSTPGIKTKNITKTLTIESRDDFSGAIATVVYFLKEEKE